MFGKGVIKGLMVTAKEAVSPRLTEKYPEEKPELASRWRGNGFVLDKETCISCGLCAMACPNKVIRQKFAKDENNKKICTEFVFDRRYCLYCGMCVEACPKNCLHMTRDFETAVYRPEDIPLDVLNPTEELAEVSEYGKKVIPPRPPVPAAKPVVKPEIKAAAPEMKPEIKSEVKPEGGGE